MSDLYFVLDEQDSKYMPCCDHIQFTYLCKHCRQDMGCYYCTFDPYEAHACMED
jgi:hypothetical protein